MPDNPKKRGKPDRTQVNIEQVHELRYWAGKLKCTQRELVLAHKAVRLCMGWAPVRPERVKGYIDWAKNHLTSVRRAH